MYVVEEEYQDAALHDIQSYLCQDMKKVVLRQSSSLGYLILEYLFAGNASIIQEFGRVQQLLENQFESEFVTTLDRSTQDLLGRHDIKASAPTSLDFAVAAL